MPVSIGTFAEGTSGMMRGNSFKRVLIAIAALSVLALTYASSALAVAWHSEPVSLDPHYDTSGSIMPIQRAIHEPLIKLSADMQYIPWLAESWEQIDETTYRFSLRQGVRYHSGNPFNAEAVKAFFDRTFDEADEGRQRGWIPDIVGAEVVDEYTIDIFSAGPHATFLDDLTRIHIHITDAVRAEEIGERHGSEPSGTGPYMLDEWRRGEMIRMIANPEYWGGVPAIEVLEFYFIPEATTAVGALEVGEIDIVWNVPPHEADRLAGSAGIEIHTASTARPMMYHFNHHPDHPLFSDLAVRRAITYAIDNDVIADVILGDMADPLRGFLGSNTWGFAEFDQPFDPERGAEILREAGWELGQVGQYDVWMKDGQRLQFTLTHANFWPRQAEVAEQVQAQLREFGALVSVTTIDRALHWDILNHGRSGAEGVAPFDMYFLGNGQRTRDGGPNLQDTYASWGITNLVQWNNAEFDAYLSEGLSPGPEEDRLAAYREAQRLLHEHAVVAQLYEVNLIQAVRTDVVGFEAHPMEEPFWERLSKR